jgi:hypothetical protein
MSEPHDDLDELLGPRPAAESAGLRDAVFRGTQRQLARGRWVRRARAAVAAAAVFAAGGLVGWFGRPTPPAAAPGAPAERVVVAVAVVPVLVTPPESPGTNLAGSPELPLSPAKLETRAELADDAAEAARLYRLAGDRYLNDRQDYPNAVRCYRLYLARAGDDGLSPDAADTWLLTSLKNAAFKEKYDAANRGE